MTILLEDILKLGLAVLVGGLIGSEREFRDKAAGFRTIIFICLGATIFMMISLKLGGFRDPVRIASNIVVGIGFLGAGAIIRERGHVTGLTTASTIWFTAAIGMVIGGGYYLLAGAAAVAGLIVLWLFPRMEHWIVGAGQARTYEVVCTGKPGKYDALEKLIVDCGLRVHSHKRAKSESRMVCTWEVFGSSKRHDILMKNLFDDEEITTFRC